MKRLSDYHDEDAIELWADLLEPISRIMKNIEIGEDEASIDIARKVLKTNKEDACKLLLRIDETPITGLNLLVRLVDIINEVVNDKELSDFLGFSESTQG